MSWIGVKLSTRSRPWLTVMAASVLTEAGQIKRTAAGYAKRIIVKGRKVQAASQVDVAGSVAVRAILIGISGPLTFNMYDPGPVHVLLPRMLMAAPRIVKSSRSGVDAGIVRSTSSRCNTRAGSRNTRTALPDSRNVPPSTKIVSSALPVWVESMKAEILSSAPAKMATALPAGRMPAPFAPLIDQSAPLRRPFRPGKLLAVLVRTSVPAPDLMSSPGPVIGPFQVSVVPAFCTPIAPPPSPKL